MNDGDDTDDDATAREMHIIIINVIIIRLVSCLYLRC